MTDYSDHNRFDIDSPRDWAGSDRRASNGDEFPSVFSVEEWRRTFPPSDSLPVDTRDTDRVPADSRWPTLEAIGLGQALDLVEAVAAFNQPKHPGGKWKTQTVAHQWGKCLSHAGRSMHGEPLDHETGLPASAHAALRLLMALGLELEQAEDQEASRLPEFAEHG